MNEKDANEAEIESETEVDHHPLSKRQVEMHRVHVEGKVTVADRDLFPTVCVLLFHCYFLYLVFAFCVKILVCFVLTKMITSF